ncbi:hypothetical protein CR513_35239, partial [Mucuna pruriens]
MNVKYVFLKILEKEVYILNNLKDIKHQECDIRKLIPTLINMVLRDVLFLIHLYVKFVDLEDIFIVCLYVDDIIFTNNNLRMIAELKKVMISCFEMTDLGMMSYFLGIEVIQQNDQFFISQKIYAVEEKLKLTKESEGKEWMQSNTKVWLGGLVCLANSWSSLVFSIYNEFFCDNDNDVKLVGYIDSD